MTTKDSKAEKRLNDAKALLEIFAGRHAANKLNRHKNAIGFLGLFSQRHVAYRKKRLKSAEAFISEFTKMQGRLDEGRDPKLNVFEILSFGNNEVALSSLLAWLFDERKSHYHQNLFLATLVKLCNLDLPIEMLFNYRVRTEHRVREADIDIMVSKKSEFLLYIENKVLSSEGDDQTPREFRDMRQAGIILGVPEDRQFAIYLTPDGRPPKDHEHWHSLSLNTLVGEYLKLGERIRSPKLNFILEDLHETTTKWS